MNVRPVANGIRTDHPIPDLPLVDDADLPLEDAEAIERIGRDAGDGRWGRADTCVNGGWAAFTSDARRPELAWCVRWHPDFGRSVVLCRAKDAPGIHGEMTFGTALLFRAGAYWWDGTTWYRPNQIWDRAGEKYLARVVPAARSVSAADLLAAGGGRADRGCLLDIEDVDLDGATSGSGAWVDNLALWAARRGPDSRPLGECIVSVTAPELTGDQLVGVAQLAEVAGVAASTLRAYIARGEGSVPAPQAQVNGRSVWSRPVAEEYAEQRKHSVESAVEAVTTTAEGQALPPGLAKLREALNQAFFGHLWHDPAGRRRWALRWRTAVSVADVSADLAARATVEVQDGIPFEDLAHVVAGAVLQEIAHQRSMRQSNGDDPEVFYGIYPQSARMLDWLIRHDPAAATTAIADIVGQSARELGIPAATTHDSIRTALSLDGELDKSTRKAFLERVFTPGSVVS